MSRALVNDTRPSSAGVRGGAHESMWLQGEGPPTQRSQVKEAQAKGSPGFHPQLLPFSAVCPQGSHPPSLCCSGLPCATGHGCSLQDWG